MNPFFVTDFSISDSLKTVRKSVLIYETIIEDAISKWKMDKNHIQHYKINSIRWIKVGNIYETKKIGE